MSLLRRERRQWTPEPFIPPYPGAAGPGQSGGIDAALRISAVWACVRLIADVVSMMELHAYTMKAGVRVPVPDPPLLVKPSADATTPEWVYMLVASLMLRGNCYGKIVRRDPQMYPAQIELYNPDAIACRIGPDGAVSYQARGQSVPYADIMHIRAYRMAGSPTGLSPIRYAASAIGREQAIQDFSLGYFTDAPHPQAVLSSEQPIDDEQARSIKERVMNRVRGREPLVFGAGISYTPLSVSPEESQFLQTQRLGVAEIARIFGVPPEMIAAEAGNSMTYANMEQKGIDFLTYSIQPWLSKIEAALSTLMPGQKHVRFDPSVLLRTDLETQMKATSIGIASKQMTPDEARRLRDEPPLTDDQKTLLALVPLSVGPTGTPKPDPGAAQAAAAAETDTP
jgi:HK97 family phage portal protein